MAFLSLMDDRAKPKGSRDPLGFEMVWSYFGRKVIGNLTTITSSLDNFTVALLGFYWANQLVSPSEEKHVRHKRVREIFLRFEQLTGYVRSYRNSTNIMGISRIQKRIQDDSFNITLGLSNEQQILSDQVSYGLWGLYSSAARSTGLVEGNDRVVTDDGQKICKEVLRQLDDKWKDVKSLLESEMTLDRKNLDLMADSFMTAIQHENVQKPLLEALMSGNDSNGVQKELWLITKSIYLEESRRPQSIEELINRIRKKKLSSNLETCLRDILEIERILVACNNLFHYCRRKDGESLELISSTLKNRYHYTYLPKTLPSGKFLRQKNLESILIAFRNHDSAKAVVEILKLNKEVMLQRNGAPWVEVESGNTLRVRVKDEKAQLASQQELEERWDYDYFLGSFRRIASNYFGSS